MNRIRSLACVLLPFAGPVLSASALAQDPAPDPLACTLSGQLVDEAGAPVAGATLTLMGWIASSDRKHEFGAPSHWTPPAAVTSDADGRYAVRFVPPRAFQFVLSVSSAGHGTVNLHWLELPEGGALDLGKTLLQPAAVLTGFIRDDDGNLGVDGWSVSAREIRQQDTSDAPGMRRLQGAASATVDPLTGEFRIETLAAGNCKVWANRGNLVRTSGDVSTRAGVETQLVLTYTGPDAAKRILVWITPPIFCPFQPEPGTVHAVALDGTRHPLAPTSDIASQWAVNELESGEYRIEIRDPRFEDWTRVGVSPGHEFSADLVGRAALDLQVIDERTGRPVTVYTFNVKYEDEEVVSRRPQLLVLAQPAPTPRVGRTIAAPALGRTAPAPIGGRITGLVPGDLMVTVLAEGLRTRAVRVPALAPGETRSLQVVLSQPDSLAGRVLDPEGRPVSGAEVQVTRGPILGHSVEHRGSFRVGALVDGIEKQVEVRFRDHRAVTNESGEFEFVDLLPGEHAIGIVESGKIRAHRVIHLPVRESVDFVVPFARPVAVSLVTPAGASTDSVVLYHRPAGPAGRDLATVLGDWNTSMIKTRAGRFEPLRLAHGPQLIELSYLVTLDSAHGLTAHRQNLWSAEFDVNAEGPEEIVVDLCAVWPNLVHVTSSFVLDAELELLPTERAGGSLSPRVSGAVGPRQMLSVFDAAPGRYAVRLSHPAWTWTSGEEIEVVLDTDGQALTIDAASGMVRRMIQITDALDAPRANTEIAWWTSSAPRSRATARTDSKGRLELLAPAGEVFLALDTPAAGTESPTATLEWVAGEGVYEVRL